MSTMTPPVIPQPFANDAGPSFINVIPDTTGDTQRASYSQGFPALTFQPEESGGKPPLGQDFNGILNVITQWLFSLQGGAVPAYDATTATAIGGYNKGALISMANGEGYWINLVDDNVTVPDTGGAGWQPVYAYGSGDPIAVTGGTRTLSAVEASRPFLLITGTLSGNQQIILPNAFRHWLVINACVLGAFTLTVKTVSGVGVPVPAGGAASPLAIYSDTVDVYRVFTPSALPTSVAATPDSILLRDNTGVAYGLTQPLADASLALATTEFVNPPSVLTATGYEVLPSGRINQWGFHAFNNSPVTINFPVPFPVACFGVQLTPRTTGAALRDKAPTTGVVNLSNFTMQDSDGSQGTYWFAYGR